MSLEQPKPRFERKGGAWSARSYERAGEVWQRRMPNGKSYCFVVLESVGWREHRVVMLEGVVLADGTGYEGGREYRLDEGIRAWHREPKCRMRRLDA